MAETPQRRTNWPLYLGVLFMLLTSVTTFPQLYALSISAILPWLGLVLPAAAVLCFILALRRAFKEPQTYRGKILGSILGVLAILLLAGSCFLFYFTRSIPVSASAPKVGQKAPDFTLNDSSGQPVSLAQLLSTPIDATQGKAPKAVLLIFYRGYW